MFKAVDDRVRGGKSRSSLSQENSNLTYVRFQGELDPTVLRTPAAFASQRTVGRWVAPDLSDYNALVLDVKSSDSKTYTISVKDNEPTRRPDGRQESTVSWEHEFHCPTENGSGRVVLHFKDFEAFYRGKRKEDADPMNWSNVRSLAIMCRSFFGKQAGPFELQLYSITAYRYRPTVQPALEAVTDEGIREKVDHNKESRRTRVIRALRSLICG